MDSIFQSITANAPSVENHMTMNENMAAGTVQIFTSFVATQKPSKIKQLRVGVVK